MVAMAESLVSVAQPVARLARLGPTASTAMVEQQAMAELGAWVRTERRESME